MNKNSKSCPTKIDPSSKNLPEWLTSRLTSYATAASLGAFACTQAADGAIVFTDIPDATITQAIPTQTIYINLDGVGYNEFAVAAFNSSIRVNPYNIAPQASRVLTSGSYYVNSFAAGASIGPGADTAKGGRVAGVQTPGGFYNFVGTDKYVGLRWDIGGGAVRFGWAQLNVSADNLGTATLTSFAYETEPNTAIIAGATGVPEPTSLALLAAGGGGLALKRRRRSA